MMSPEIHRKLKLLFVSRDKFPPFRVDVAVLFAKELARRGHQIHYLLQSDADNRRFYSTTLSGGKAFVGATDNKPNLLNRLHKHWLSVFNDLRLIRLAKQERYDFIQVKDKFIAALIGILISKLSGKKFFFWLSYPFPEADIYEYNTGTARYPFLYLIRGLTFKFLLYKLILPLSDHIFVQSEQMKKDIEQQGFSPEKLTPVPMAIDLDDYQTANGQTDGPQSKETGSIIYLGTMQKLRRVDFVIRVFQKVLAQMPDAKLYMVGDSENKEDLEFLKREAKRLHVDHATVFTGNLQRVAALQLVSRVAVGLSPFLPTPVLNSTSPTKLIEYLSRGTPAVANDHPEQRRILNESKAGYCVQYNETAFADAILKILKDSEQSAMMGKNGIQYILNKRNYHIIAGLVESQYYAALS